MDNQIAQLSDKTLTEKLVLMVQNETEATAELLLHLAELDQRRLYRDLGYSSLFAYLVGALRYSATAAKRRIAAAKCIRDFPEVYQMFLKKEVSLSTISIFAPVLNEQNKSLVLAQVVGKSQTDVEWIVGRFNVTKPSFDRIVPIVVKTTQGQINRAVDFTEPGIPYQKLTPSPQRTQGELSGNGVSSQLCFEERFRFEFQASKEFKNKLDTVKALVSGRPSPGANLEQVVELLMDEYIDKHAPGRREERRKVREQRQATRGKLRSIPEHQASYSKTISRRTRDKVILRDRFKCTFVSSDGVPCYETKGLHLDHIVPKAKGGLNTFENLRLLCGPHNRLAAEQEFGKPFMQQYY